MSKSPQSKLDEPTRCELRIRRYKTAAALMAYFLEDDGAMKTMEFPTWMKAAARDAVCAADILLDELDRTRKDLALGAETET